MGDGLLTGTGLFARGDELQFGGVVVESALDGSEVVFVGQVLNVNFQRDGVTGSGVVPFGVGDAFDFDGEIGVNEFFRRNGTDRSGTQNEEQRHNK